MALLNILSGISRAEPSVIILSGTHRLRAQVVALPGAGVPIALMIAPLVAVGVEAEVLVVRQSPGATAVAVALLRLPLWVAGPPPCRGFLTTLPRLPVCVACLPCCQGFFFLGAWEYFKKAKKYGRKAGMGTGTWRWQNELPSPPLLQPEASLTAASLCLQSPPSPFTCQSLCLDMQMGCLHSRAFLQETNPRFLEERSDWCSWIKPSLSFNPPHPPMAQQWWVQDFT